MKKSKLVWKLALYKFYEKSKLISLKNAIVENYKC